MEIIDRMIRAAKLDASLYEEVEKDLTATNQAILVVVIASISSGIGSAIGGQMVGGLGGFVFGLVGGAIAALVGWFIWSFITYFIGTRLFKGPQTEATYGELLRCIGFSNSPGILAILVFIPIIGAVIAFIAWIWSLIAMVIAVRQALDFSTGRAIATCIVGFIVMMIIIAAIGIATGGLLALQGWM
ncbi:YIP1 family protein [[Eubacterium] cellulosolvens]